MGFEIEEVSARETPEDNLSENGALSEEEQEKVVHRIKLRAPAVYATIKAEGEAELARPSSSLFFSGIVAGIGMGFSILTLALIRLHLPNTSWEPLISSFGYAAGFLIVILGRQQLFTESTLTAVLPVISSPSWKGLADTMRVWSVVFLANAIGCVLVATGLVTLELVPARVGAAMVDASVHLTHLSPHQVFVRGIGAGFLVAAMVWMMPGTKSGEFALISFTAWLIALGGFTHVIAGMVEITALVLTGHLGAAEGLFTLTMPMLAGNVLGGTFLFAALAYAQVYDEVKPDR